MKRADFPICDHCGEVILPTDRKGAFDRMHMECGFRSVAGGPNHIARLCHCYGGRAEPDLPTLSKRQNAELAWDIYNRKMTHHLRPHKKA